MPERGWSGCRALSSRGAVGRNSGGIAHPVSHCQRGGGGGWRRGLAGCQAAAVRDGKASLEEQRRGGSGAPPATPRSGREGRCHPLATRPSWAAQLGVRWRSPSYVRAFKNLPHERRPLPASCPFRFQTVQTLSPIEMIDLENQFHLRRTPRTASIEISFTYDSSQTHRRHGWALKTWCGGHKRLGAPRLLSIPCVQSATRCCAHGHPRASSWTHVGRCVPQGGGRPG